MFGQVLGGLSEDFFLSCCAAEHDEMGEDLNWLDYLDLAWEVLEVLGEPVDPFVVCH